MSILNNQAEALVKVQSMGKQELEEIFGTFSPVKGNVIGALYNTDTDGMKNLLLHTNPAGVLTGLKIVSTLTGASKAQLIVNCEVNEQELAANANMLGLSLTIVRDDFVQIQDHEEDALFCFDELAAMAEKLMGRRSGVLLAVDEGVPEEVPSDTKIASLIPTGIKGVLSDHAFLSPNMLEEMTVADLKSKSGVLHTIKEGECTVDLLNKELEALRKRSCGRCVFCREGLYQLGRTVSEITQGRSKAQDIATAKEIAEAMMTSCSCSLGDHAGLPYISVTQNFAQEFEAHAKRKECASGVCLALIQYYVDPARCVGCGECRKVCPKDCIEGKTGYVSMIDSFGCSRCGECLKACPNKAVVKTSGRVPNLPTRLTRVKGMKVQEEAAPEKERSETGRRRRNFGRAAAKSVPVSDETIKAAVPGTAEPAGAAESKQNAESASQAVEVKFTPAEEAQKPAAAAEISEKTEGKDTNPEAPAPEKISEEPAARAAAPGKRRRTYARAKDSSKKE